jgi:hypothetical protein
MASNFTYSIVKAPVMPIFSGNLCIAAGIAAGKLNYTPFVPIYRRYSFSHEY